MPDPGKIDIDALERAVTAALDADFAAMTAQGQEFQQRTYAMMAAWQPVPPQMLIAFAEGLTRWVAHFQQALPAAERLAKEGRPAVRDRLKMIIDDLAKAVPVYYQMAGAGAAHVMGLAKIMSDSNIEVARTWSESNAATAGVYAALNAEFKL